MRLTPDDITNNGLQNVARVVRDIVGDLCEREYSKSYKNLNAVRVFEGKKAAIEIELERKENSIWFYLRKGPEPENDTYFLPRDDNGKTIRGYLQNIAVGNHWIPYNSSPKHHSELESIEANLVIVQTNREKIFEADWHLIPYSGRAPFPFADNASSSF